MIWAVIWYGLLAVMTTADILTTKIALAMGMHEINPFLAPVVQHIVLIKFAFLLVTIGIILWMEKTKKGSGWLAPAGGTCVTFVAVVSNITVLASV